MKQNKTTQFFGKVVGGGFNQTNHSATNQQNMAIRPLRLPPAFSSKQLWVETPCR
jgi:hypothetical protein